MRRIFMYCCNTWILHVCEFSVLSDTPDYDVQDICNSECCLENLGADLQP
ncbi:hypothetical protein M758_9G159500 [Ceratodon purpureus]|nr:hypothetical protein M758_9G159500 [Ceratodon purpureus]